MTVIQVPSVREALAYFLAGVHRVDWGEKRCRPSVWATDCRDVRFFVANRIVLGLFVVALLNDVGAYNVNDFTYQNMIRCDLSGKIVFADSKRQTEGSLLGKSHVKFLTKGHPECSRAESCRISARIAWASTKTWSPRMAVSVGASRANTKTGCSRVANQYKWCDHEYMTNCQALHRNEERHLPRAGSHSWGSPARKRRQAVQRLW
jgi:hypothetical protein